MTLGILDRPEVAMSVALVLLALLPAPGFQAAADDPDRAERAAIVDRIMAEPPRLRLERPAPLEGPGGDQDAARWKVLNEKKAQSNNNFDRWLFDDDADEATRRARLNSLLAEKLIASQKGRRLGPEQLRKLRLAGTGDIKRLFDRAAGRRAEFESVRDDNTQGRRILMDVTSLAREFRIGPFDEDSLYAKTLRKIDEDERAARYGPK